AQPLLSASWDRASVSMAEYRDLRSALSEVTSGVAAWSIGQEVLDGENPEQVAVARVSASLLDVLAVRPALGQALSPADEVIGGAPAAMISYEAWVARYGRDPAVFRRPIMLNGRAFTIVGVLPPRLGLGRRNTNPMFW